MATSYIHFPTRFLKVTFTFLKVTTVHSHFPLGFPQFTFTFPNNLKLTFTHQITCFFYFCFSLSYKLPTNHSYFPLLLYLFTFLSTFLFFTNYQEFLSNILTVTYDLQSSSSELPAIHFPTSHLQCTLALVLTNFSLSFANLVEAYFQTTPRVMFGTFQ